MSVLEEERMARYVQQRPMVAVMREDGTIYFPHSKPLQEQVTDWTIAALWLVSVVVLVATFF
jgi:hypothetical protein